MQIATSLPVQAGRIGTTFVQLIRLLDLNVSAVVRFSNEYAFTERLEEWLLIPVPGPGWSPEQISLAGYENLTDLAKSLESKEPQDLSRQERLKVTILASEWQRPGLVSEFKLKFSTRHIEGVGNVLSVVLGKTSIIEKFNEKQEELLKN